MFLNLMTKIQKFQEAVFVELPRNSFQLQTNPDYSSLHTGLIFVDVVNVNAATHVRLSILKHMLQDPKVHTK